jgi:hypothetical protein
MFRVAVFSVLLVVAGSAAAPVPREEQRPPVPLAGSVWEGDGVVAPTVYVFNEDGRMTLTYKGNTHLNCGTWEQHGTRIYWQTNNRYCEFEGKLTGTTISGRSWNKPGGNWQLTVKRKGLEK